MLGVAYWTCTHCPMVSDSMPCIVLA
jgi:hypothetical protein